MIGKLLSPLRAGKARSRFADIAAPNTLQITSPAFTDSAAIPTRHAGQGVGENTSPPLTWNGAPDTTKQFILIIEDIDVPLPRPFVHTVALIDPDRRHLDQGDLQPGTPGLRFLPGTRGSLGYAGPRPIPGHGPHHYLFELFALDEAISNSVTTTRTLPAAMHGHILARGTLTGTYQRR
jgi:Raf kinase inhibitor-like YbhB/YbcL family protein